MDPEAKITTQQQKGQANQTQGRHGELEGTKKEARQKRNQGWTAQSEKVSYLNIVRNGGWIKANTKNNNNYNNRTDGQPLGIDRQTPAAGSQVSGNSTRSVEITIKNK